jgi:23S rRNA (guanosine2251-2'-O)-methyltransferase
MAEMRSYTITIPKSLHRSEHPHSTLTSHILNIVMRSFRLHMVAAPIQLLHLSPPLFYVTRAFINTENSRFWVKRITIQGTEKALSKASITENFNWKSLNLSDAEYAILISPKLQMLWPICSGVLQTQHVLDLKVSAVPLASNSEVDNSCLVCGFFPRSSYEQHDERVIDPDIKTLLDAVLTKLLHIQGDDLLNNEKYLGSPPRNIYKSFVAPRVRRNQSSIDLEKSAHRTAFQIQHALKQMHADAAAQYLRNTDNNNNRNLPLALKGKELVLVLDNLRSAHNVGSIFRTAETAGIVEVITVGITAHPPNAKLQKTALSATQLVNTRHFDTISSAVSSLRCAGYSIVAMETTKISRSYTDVRYGEKVALILGNENTGVDTDVLESADCIVEIPMFGYKNSLNVAAAAPVVVFEVIRQWCKTNDQQDTSSEARNPSGS